MKDKAYFKLREPLSLILTYMYLVGVNARLHSLLTHVFKHDKNLEGDEKHQTNM